MNQEQKSRPLRDFTLVLLGMMLGLLIAVIVFALCWWLVVYGYITL